MNTRSMKAWLILLLAAVLTVAGIQPALAGTRPATSHPNPGPLSTVDSGHPRLWFDAASVAQLQDRWDDSLYNAIKQQAINYFQSTAQTVTAKMNRVTAGALISLATGQASYCEAAITEGWSIMSDGLYLDYNNRYAAYADAPALVFDWCYHHLSSQEKSDWVAKLNDRVLYWENQIVSKMVWHESFPFHTPYISIALAIHGEPGANSRLAQAQNVLLNLRDIENEIMAEGAFKPYPYQFRYAPFSSLLWSRATNRNITAESGLMQNLGTYLAYRLSKQKNMFSVGEGDHETTADGNVIAAQTPGGASTLYALAAHLNDGVAQWVADQLRTHGDQGTRFGALSSDPNWLAFIFHNPSQVTATSPTQAGLPLAKLFASNNQMTTRSGWSFDSGNDIVAWLYGGTFDSHASEGSSGHWTIKRGDDVLAGNGFAYMGAPSVYRDKYAKHSIAFNTLLFEPAGTSTPDISAGYKPSPSHTDGRPHWDSALDQSKYPNTYAISNYMPVHYQGEITYFYNTAAYSITTAEPQFMYRDRVDEFKRDFIHIRPGLFIVNDRFAPKSNVAYLRWVLHSKTKPSWPGSTTVVEGTSSAGVLESTNSNNFTIVSGGSKLKTSLVWPQNPTKLKATGGSKDNPGLPLSQRYYGYEAYVDGTEYSAYHHAQSSRSEEFKLAGYEAQKDQWRTEIYTTPSAANGQMIVAMHADAAGASSPSYSYTNVSGGKKVTVTYQGVTYEIFCPNTPNGTPTVTVFGSNPPSELIIDFESGEGYTTGSLYGQNGWTQAVTVGGSAVVQTSHKSSGSRGVTLSTPANAAQYEYEMAKKTFTPFTSPELELSILQPSSAAAYAFFRANASDGKEAVHIRFSGGNVQAKYANTWNTLTGVSYSDNVWDRWKADIHTAAGTYDLYKNGTLVYSNIPFSDTSASNIGSVSIGTTHKTTGTAAVTHFDRIRIAE